MLNGRFLVEQLLGLMSALLVGQVAVLIYIRETEIEKLPTAESTDVDTRSRHA
jgi:hypothetical protein